MTYSAKRYSEIMKMVYEMQIMDIEEEKTNSKIVCEYEEGFNDGIIRGLEIAIEKIELSGFLTDEEKENPQFKKVECYDFIMKTDNERM